MPQHRKIRVHEPLHTVLGTALLGLLKLAGRDAPRDAFRPAYVGEVVDSCNTKRLVGTQRTATWGWMRK